MRVNHDILCCDVVGGWGILLQSSSVQLLFGSGWCVGGRFLVVIVIGACIVFGYGICWPWRHASPSVLANMWFASGCWGTCIIGWKDGWSGLVSVSGRVGNRLGIGFQIVWLDCWLCCVCRGRVGEEECIVERRYCGFVTRIRGTFVSVFLCWLTGL